MSVGITRATTPTLTLKIKQDDIDLTEAQSVYLTLERGANVITKSGDELEVTENAVSCFLDQEETLAFPEGSSVEVQANFLFRDGDRIRRLSTKPQCFTVDKQLLRRVIS